LRPWLIGSPPDSARFAGRFATAAQNSSWQAGFTDFIRRLLGDVFLLSAAAIRKFPTMCRVDVFDYDKHTSKPKGVVEVTL